MVVSMVAKILTKEDLWSTVVGGAALATGGGGASPSYETFSKEVDPLFGSGLKPKLIDADEVPKGEIIFISAGIGGGLEREKAEKYLRRFGSVQEWIKEMDRVFPIPSWAEIPGEDWPQAIHKRMVQLKGKEPYGYMPFEIGPNNYRYFTAPDNRGKCVVDADNAGYRAVPELSLATLNVMNAPVAPVIASTGWGDLAVFEKLLSWQRAEDLLRHVAIISGGGCQSLTAFSDDWIKKGTVHGTLSLSMKVGKAILKARKDKTDPVEAILKAASGYKLFEGEVAAYTNEGKNSFTWGSAWIKGTGKNARHTMKIWFQNENQISWIDDKPYVTCPDPFTVVDRETGEGLSNFRVTDWPQGRKVVVWGMKSAAPWRTERGLRIYNPKHFGFDIEYKPIEKIVKA
jgi:DUF917 family protein